MGDTDLPFYLIDIRVYYHRVKLLLYTYLKLESQKKSYCRKKSSCG
jgi:hypothetical protein